MNLFQQIVWIHVTVWIMNLIMKAGHGAGKECAARCRDIAVVS
jgi:hypothetical protein